MPTSMRSSIRSTRSAYGLELLATVHWCATRDDGVETAAEAAGCVQAWNQRKGRMFTDEHVEVSWNHLRDQGWIGEHEPAASARN